MMTADQSSEPAVPAARQLVELVLPVVKDSIDMAASAFA